ncbi:MAG: GxxExxY protein [Methanohalobium sp.]|uniref:GxxExxY protein n=1 Tax=Methanohalobium sp. TaxID=2837493 RepID=UPI00397CCE7B
MVVIKNKISRLRTDRIFYNISDFLESETSFRYGKHKTEKDYQQNLEGKLAVLTERHGYNIRYEAVPKNSKYRVDFVIENLVGREMKFYQGGIKIEEQLCRQIVNYSKYYSRMIGLVLNNTHKDNQELKAEIEGELKKQDEIDKSNYKVIVKSIGKR